MCARVSVGMLHSYWVIRGLFKLFQVIKSSSLAHYLFKVQGVDVACWPNTVNNYSMLHTVHMICAIYIVWEMFFIFFHKHFWFSSALFRYPDFFSSWMIRLDDDGLWWWMMMMIIMIDDDDEAWWIMIMIGGGWWMR